MSGALEKRKQFVEQWLSEGRPMTELCAQYGTRQPQVIWPAVSTMGAPIADRTLAALARRPFDFAQGKLRPPLHRHVRASARFSVATPPAPSCTKAIQHGTPSDPFHAVLLQS